MTAVVDVRGLSAFYRTRSGEEIRAVSNVSFSVEGGTVLGIAGESGCGKSTLVKALMGLYFPPLFHGSGSVMLKGKDILSLTAEARRGGLAEGKMRLEGLVRVRSR